jgi:hypothetical protein
MRRGLCDVVVHDYSVLRWHSRPPLLVVPFLRRWLAQHRCAVQRVDHKISRYGTSPGRAAAVVTRPHCATSPVCLLLVSPLVRFAPDRCRILITGTPASPRPFGTARTPVQARRPPRQASDVASYRPGATLPPSQHFVLPLVQVTFVRHEYRQELPPASSLSVELTRARF